MGNSVVAIVAYPFYFSATAHILSCGYQAYGCLASTVRRRGFTWQAFCGSISIRLDASGLLRDRTVSVPSTHQERSERRSGGRRPYRLRAQHARERDACWLRLGTLSKPLRSPSRTFFHEYLPDSASNSSQGRRCAPETASAAHPSRCEATPPRRACFFGQGASRSPQSIDTDRPISTYHPQAVLKALRREVPRDAHRSEERGVGQE